MQYKCSQCEKYFTTKKKRDDHVKRVHSKPVNSPAQSTPQTAGKTLELKVDKKKAEEKSEAKRYHCVDCGFKGLKYGQERCPNCGAKLDWSQL